MCREELIDFDKYIINKDGSIFSKHWNKIINGWVDKDGYLVACLTLKNGIRQPYRINRVIAYLFVDRPKHLENIPLEDLQVGHNDTNKQNNNINNLYWCTAKENNNNPLTKEKQIGREPWNKGVKNCFDEETINIMSKTRSKPINQYDLNGTLIKTWPSIKEASENLKIFATSISSCAKKHKHNKTAGGFKWEYLKNQ